jgi:hypothetical protein
MKERAMGDRSDVEPPPVGDEDSTCRPSPHDAGRRSSAWPEAAQRRYADLQVLEELAAQVVVETHAEVRRTCLEEAGAILREHLGERISDEWTELVEELLSRFRALASDAGHVRVLGLHLKKCRRGWVSVRRKAYREREELRRALAVPPKATRAPGVGMPAPVPASRGAVAASPAGTSRAQGAPAAAPEPSEFGDLPSMLGNRVILVVSGAHVSPEIVAWLGRHFAAGQVRVMQGKDEGSSVTPYLSARYCRAASLSAVLAVLG